MDFLTQLLFQLINKVFFLQPWYDTGRFFVQSQATVQRFPYPFIREYPLAEYFARDFVEESVKKKNIGCKCHYFQIYKIT